MLNKRIGNKVYHYENGKLSIKLCSSPEAAKKAVRLLQGIENIRIVLAKMYEKNTIKVN